jgi:hypothetical protein
MSDCDLTRLLPWIWRHAPAVANAANKMIVRIVTAVAPSTDIYTNCWPGKLATSALGR